MRALLVYDPELTPLLMPTRTPKMRWVAPILTAILLAALFPVFLARTARIEPHVRQSPIELHSYLARGSSHPPAQELPLNRKEWDLDLVLHSEAVGCAIDIVDERNAKVVWSATDLKVEGRRLQLTISSAWLEAGDWRIDVFDRERTKSLGTFHIRAGALRSSRP